MKKGFVGIGSRGIRGNLGVGVGKIVVGPLGVGVADGA